MPVFAVIIFVPLQFLSQRVGLNLLKQPLLKQPLLKQPLLKQPFFTKISTSHEKSFTLRNGAVV